MAAPRKRGGCRVAAAERLADAKIELAQTERTLARLESIRNSALLSDDDGAAQNFTLEIHALRSAAKRYRRQIEVLEARAARETEDRRRTEYEAQIARVEVKFAHQARDAARLEKALGQAVSTFRRMLDRGRQISALLPRENDAGLLITPVEIRLALEHEIFRAAGGLNFPGARAGSTAALADVVRRAAERASTIMRTEEHGHLAA